MKTLIVLGMHRSITSLISKGMADNNVYIGDSLLPPNGGNPNGYWEDVDFVRMNNRLLNLAGGSWKEPPSEDSINFLEMGYGEEIKKLIKKKERRVKSLFPKERNQLWGWKDPRTTLTIRLYLPYLTNPHFILCFRDPIEVARSLNKTEKVSLEDGVNLWREYNRRLIRFISDYYVDKSSSPEILKAIREDKDE